MLWAGSVARWSAYLCVFIVVGSAAFRWLLRARAGRPIGAATEEFVTRCEREIAALAMTAGFALVAIDLLRLWQQAQAFFGADEPVTLELARTIADATLWGSGWKLQVISAIGAGVGFAAALRGRRIGWAVATAAALAVGLSRPLTGHALEQGTWISVPAVAQATHVLAAAIWIGTLAILILVGVRNAARLPVDVRGPCIAGLVAGFSPVALTAAALLFVAGSITTFLYVGSFGALFGTAYGRVLMAKIAGFGAVMAVGYFNWQRVRPQLEAIGETFESGPRTERLLMRSAGVEIALAAAVLAATAALVAMPLPMG